MAISVVTFGCRLNAAESEVIRAAAARAGLDGAVIVNTCAVTAEAERQGRQAIRRARREHPGARIIVTGCAATLAPERYQALAEVDAVIDNNAKLRVESYLPQAPVLDQRAVPPPVAAGRLGPARAYLEVQHGCDHRCTFCIIPFARGPSRSRAPAEIVREARRLVAEGAREIVLTGVDLTAYGADLPQRRTLGGLARHILDQLPALPRLRLSSLDPAEIDEDLWRLFADEPRLMPHLHLSLQAGDDLILKRMRRRHSRATAIAVARRARALRPEVALGADLIAGFPTESEEMFQRSLDLVGACGLAFLHVFPYSARPGTPAARMPGVPAEVVRERAARLREAAKKALAGDLAARVGGENEVLIEGPGLGRATFYAQVAFAEPGEAGEAGAIRRMRLVGGTADRLVGVPVT